MEARVEASRGSNGLRGIALGGPSANHAHIGVRASDRVVEAVGDPPAHEQPPALVDVGLRSPGARPRSDADIVEHNRHTVGVVARRRASVYTRLHDLNRQVSRLLRRNTGAVARGMRLAPL